MIEHKTKHQISIQLGGRPFLHSRHGSDTRQETVRDLQPGEYVDLKKIDYSQNRNKFYDFL